MQVIAMGKRFSTFLVDDGSLDTVIRVQPIAPDANGKMLHCEDVRFDSEYASQFRFKDGRMKLGGFKQLSKEAAEVYAMGGE